MCLEPPKTVEDHIQILAAASNEKVDKSLKVAAHHAFIRQSQTLPAVSDEDFMVGLFLSIFS